MPTITDRTRKRLSQKQLRNQCRASRRQQARKARASRRQIDRIHHQLPKQVRTVFDPLEPAFTHPTHHRFVLLALAAILTLGGRTIANLLRCLGSLAPGHPSSYHRIFSRDRWSSWTLARCFAQQVLARFVPDGPIELAGDDTVEEHPGKKVYGKGCHRDPVRSTHSLHRLPLGAQVGRLDRACPGPLCHASLGVASADGAVPARGRKPPARAAAQDALGIDAADVGCLDPLVPRPPVHLHRRRRLRQPRLGQLRTSALPSFEPGQPLLSQRQLVRSAAAGPRQEAEPSAPQEGGQAARSSSGRGCDGPTEKAQRLLVRWWPPQCRSRQRDGPMVPERRGVDTDSLGIRPRPDRDSS